MDIHGVYEPAEVILGLSNTAGKTPGNIGKSLKKMGDSAANKAR